ncbi:MMPL family transporter [Amycolatopsis sp. NPDC059021]|uniref:MMPL family transporter n=1 Tax=Amycolatopsis sp. NPDC059021 TaxID=3346704 RepID=UPI00366B0FC1
MLPTGTPDRRGPVIERIAGWSIRHRAAVLLGWLALVVLALTVGSLVPGSSLPSSDAGESGTAQGILRAQNIYEPLLENVLVQRREQRDDVELRSATDDLVRTLQASGAVTGLRTPVDAPDGRSRLVTFQITGTDTEIRPHFTAASAAVDAVAARHPAILVAQAGDLSLSTVVDKSIKQDIKRSELISLPLTVVILLFVFGSLIAASIPLLLTATTVAATFGFLSAVDKVVPINSATTVMTLLIGTAVGVDYSLFFLRREREERAAGRPVDDAIRTAAGTSGRVVVVSGLTVALCVAGLGFTGLDQLRGFAISSILVVGLTVAASVTALPALLSLLGHWVDRGRLPWLGRRRTTADHSRFWAKVAEVVTRRPTLWGGLAVVLLAVLALPASRIQLQAPLATESLPRSVPVIDAAVRMQDAFPGAAIPAHVVVWNERGGPVDTPAVRNAIGELGARTAGPVVTVSVDRALVVRVPLAGNGSLASDQALGTLRDHVLPQTLGKVGGVGFAVAGKTAIAHDFAAKVADRTPYVFGFILLLAFVLLWAAFRSIGVAIMSIALNLLSVGAAYGVLTWVFQDGNFASLLGFTPYGGVLDWLPVFLFVLLFGLSMDYHIFILSRIRERWLSGMSARDAIIGGTASGAGVVTSAAVIMTGVFSVFLTLSAIEYKMIGLGMAFAILLDATLIRGVLLPAALTVLGRRLGKPVSPADRDAGPRTVSPARKRVRPVAR